MSDWRVIRVAAAAAVVACSGGDAPLHGVVVDPPQEVPAVRIADARGTLYDLDSERGKHTVLLFFGYTRCPDVCPATLADWAHAKRALGTAASGVRWVFVSVDPARDTPQVAHDYAVQFDTSFVGLSPTAPQLDSLQQTWGFTVTREVVPGAAAAYTVSHPAGSFVIDRAGRIRLIYPPSTAAADIAADLRRLK